MIASCKQKFYNPKITVYFGVCSKLPNQQITFLNLWSNLCLLHLLYLSLVAYIQPMQNIKILIRSFFFSIKGAVLLVCLCVCLCQLRDNRILVSQKSSSHRGDMSYCCYVAYWIEHVSVIHYYHIIFLILTVCKIFWWPYSEIIDLCQGCAAVINCN